MDVNGPLQIARDINRGLWCRHIEPKSAILAVKRRAAGQIHVNIFAHICVFGNKNVPDNIRV